MTIAFVLSDWHSIGGIQRNATEFCQASRDLGHTVVPITRLSDCWKMWRCDLIIIGHVNLLPLAVLAPWKANVWLFIYGLDVWKPITLRHLMGLWRVTKVITISKYTMDEAKKYLGDKPYTILPCTC